MSKLLSLLPLLLIGACSSCQDKPVPPGPLDTGGYAPTPEVTGGMPGTGGTQGTGGEEPSTGGVSTGGSATGGEQGTGGRPAPSDDCQAAEWKIQDLNCLNADKKPRWLTPGGKPMADACRASVARGAMCPKCLAKITTCAGIDACQPTDTGVCPK